MGTFIAITASPDLAAPEDLYRQSEQAGRSNAGVSPKSSVRTPWCFAASFPRHNGSGFPIAHNSKTGNWLALVGTCFHPSGRNDPEALLEEYLRFGADQLARSLEGFFTVIVGDASHQEITVITDIIGSCHFYVRQLANAAALSSSSLALASLADVTLDAIGCQEFLGTGILYEDRTLFREIKKLPPASIVAFRDGHEVGRRAYWNLAALAPESLSDEAATEQLWESLISAAGKIGSQHDPLVCDLTGGYDSRAMAAAFVGSRQKFSTAVSGPEDSADVVISTGLAKQLGLEHLHSPPQAGPSFSELQIALQLSDGEYDVVEYSSIARIHRKLAERFQISINGSFGEVARGYWWELLAPHTGAVRKLDSYKLSTRRYAWTSCNDLFQPPFQMDLATHMASVIDRATSDLGGFPNTFQMDAAYVRMRMQRWQGRIASSTNKLWPCLSPFMFRSVLETTLQARHQVRQRSLLVRKMLERYEPAIANYPLEHGYPAVPARLGNLTRFWPIVPYYSGKVAQKLGLRQLPPKDPSQQDVPRLALWKSGEVRELLDPRTMRIAAVLEPGALAAFLDASKKPEFTRNAEWNRLLGMEMALVACTRGAAMKTV